MLAKYDLLSHLNKLDESMELETEDHKSLPSFGACSTRGYYIS